jgi:hypothetical protein
MTTEPDTDPTIDEQEYPTVDELDTDHRETVQPLPVVHAMIEAPAASSGAGGQDL